MANPTGRLIGEGGPARGEVSGTECGSFERRKGDSEETRRRRRKKRVGVGAGEAEPGGGIGHALIRGQCGAGEVGHARHLYQGDSLDEIWPTPRRMAPPYGLAETPKPAAGERP